MKYIKKKDERCTLISDGGGELTAMDFASWK